MFAAKFILPLLALVGWAHAAEPWSEDRLLAAANPDDLANTCYFAIFPGDKCVGGGVYKISPDWYAKHGGGSFAVINGCGTVQSNWLGRYMIHASYQSLAEASEDLIGGPSEADRATFVAPLDCGEPWSEDRLLAAADPDDLANTCYFAIFPGDKCVGGGVYKISPDWYAKHGGGPFAAINGCGTVQSNWLGRSGSHVTYQSQAEASEDLAADRATFVAPLDCSDGTTEEPTTAMSADTIAFIAFNTEMANFGADLAGLRAFTKAEAAKCACADFDDIVTVCGSACTISANLENSLEKQASSGTFASSAAAVVIAGLAAALY